jgi:hypothetical protein
MSIRLPAGILVLLVCLAFCHGCGGGSSQGSAQNAQARGSLQFDIVWPAPSRVIPAAAQSLVIQVSSGSQTVVRKIIPRPPAGTNTSSVRFDSLTPGVVNVTVTAFPNSDGTGIAQAIGGTTVAIISGITTQATIDPSSTVDHIDLAPSPLVTIPNHSIALVPSPQNAQNALVLVAPSSLTWTSSTTGVATVDVNGAVTGVALGDASVRVVDTESGHTASVDVHVVPPIVINPGQATVSIGDSVQFSATVTVLSSPNVTWRVQEALVGGTIDSEGNYTAPGQPGTFHVVATSVSDPTISATATVVVQSGSGTVIIR